MSKNAVSKWERGLNLPDVSVMQPLCAALGISLNELFAGEELADENYRKAADGNLLDALQNSAFTLGEKIAFYKRKWAKEHAFKMVLCVVSLLVLIAALTLQGVQGYMIATAAGLLAMLFYVVLYNQMMAYVEDRAYKKTEK